MNWRAFAVATLLLATIPHTVSAQSIGFAEAIDRLAARCGKDIDKFCKKTNFGGGRILQCLDRNAAAISPSCKAARTEVAVLLTTRSEARKRIPRVCENDIRRLCSGVQPGDGNLMECFYKAKARVNPECQRAVAEAGYE